MHSVSTSVLLEFMVLLQLVFCFQHGFPGDIFFLLHSPLHEVSHVPTLKSETGNPDLKLILCWTFVGYADFPLVEHGPFNYLDFAVEHICVSLKLRSIKG